MIVGQVRRWIRVVGIVYLAAGFAAGCAGRRGAATASGGSYSFAFVSDTHIVTADLSGPKGENAARLEAAMGEIARRPDIEFIVHGGDLVEQAGNAEQFAAFESLMKPSVPWYPIAGNHDIGKPPDAAKIALWIQRGYGRGPNNREYYGFVHKNGAFFVLDTFACDATDPEVRRRSDDQLEEMDRFFAANTGIPNKFVCGHAPLFVRSAGEPDEYFNIPSGYRARILEVMTRRGVETYLSGHRHQEATVVDPCGVTEYTQTSLAFALGERKQIGYSVFTVTDSGTTKEFVPVEVAAPAPPPAEITKTDTTGTSLILLGDLHYDLLGDHDMEWLKTKPDDLRQVTQEYTVFTEKFWKSRMEMLASLSGRCEPPVGALIQLGDLQEGLAGTPDLARKMARDTLEALEPKRFAAPWILVKGNHDITGPGAREAYQDIVVPFLREELKKDIQNPWYTYCLGDVEIFAADTYEPEGLLPFLESELPRSTAKVKLVAMHQPVIPVTGRCWHALNRPEDAESRDRLLRLLARNRAIVLCGHLHRYSVVRRTTPEGPVVQVMVNSVVRDEAHATPYQSTREYGPGLIDLEPRFSPDTRGRRSAMLGAEAPFVTDYRMADLPGYAILSIQGNPPRTVLRMYPNLLDKLFEEVDISELQRP